MIKQLLLFMLAHSDMNYLQLEIYKYTNWINRPQDTKSGCFFAALRRFTVSFIASYPWHLLPLFSSLTSHTVTKLRKKLIATLSFFWHVHSSDLCSSGSWRPSPAREKEGSNLQKMAGRKWKRYKLGFTSGNVNMLRLDIVWHFEYYYIVLVLTLNHIPESLFKSTNVSVISHFIIDL